MIRGVALLTLVAFAPGIAGAQSGQWASDAVARLQSRGLFVGYPDGSVRGGRALTRYEMAVALHGAYLRLLERETELDTLIRGLDSQIGGAPLSKGEPVDLSGVVGSVRSLRALSTDIRDLQTLARGFEFELTALGVKVGDILVRLKQLEKTVAALEAKVSPIRLSVELNTLAIGSASARFPALDRDGRIGGFTLGVPDLRPDGSLANPAGISRTAHVFQEAILRIDSAAPSGMRVEGLAAVGNLVWPGFGDAEGSVLGQEYSERGYAVFWDRLNLAVPVNGGASLRLGRLGVVGSELALRLPDTTSLFRSERWDNGAYRIDGVSLRHGRVGGFAGVFAPDTSLRPVGRGVSVGEHDLNRVFGLDGELPIGRRTVLRASVYRALDLPDLVFPTMNSRVDRTDVFDAELNSDVGSVKIAGAYAMQTWYRENQTVSDRDGASWYVRAQVERSGARLGAEFRTVDASFQTPGDWGRLGIERNPTNVERLGASGSIRLSSRLVVEASGYRYQVRDRRLDGTLTDSTDGAASTSIAANFDLSAKLKVGVAFEQHRFNAPGDDPRYAWTILGLSYDLGTTGEVSLGYDWCDVQNERALSLPAKRFRGGQLYAQVSVRF